MTEENLEDALKAATQDEALQLKDKGNEFAKLGQYSEAVQCYTKAIKIKPDYADAWNNLGLVLIKLGKIDEAKRVNERLQEIKSKEASQNPFSTPIQDISSTITGKSCPQCNVELKYPEAEICPNCGNRLKDPPKVEIAKLDRRPFWLGLFGGAVGILVGLLGFALTGLSLFGKSKETTALLAVLTFLVILFSLIGMISGLIGHSKRSGILMILSGIIVLLCSYFVGFLASIFFVVGGFIQYRNTR